MKNFYEESTEQEWKTFFRVFIEDETLSHIRHTSLSETFSRTVEAISSPDSELERFKKENGKWEEYSFHNSGWGPGPSGRIISYAMQNMYGAMDSINESMERGSISRNPNSKLPHIFLNTLDEFKKFLNKIEGEDFEAQDLICPRLRNIQESCEKIASNNINYESQEEVFEGYLDEDIKVYLRQKLLKEPTDLWRVKESGAAPFINEKFKGRQPTLFCASRTHKKAESTFFDYFSNIPGRTPGEHREYLDEMVDANFDSPKVKTAYNEIIESDDYKHSHVEHEKIKFMDDLDEFGSKVKQNLSNEKEFLAAINVAKLLSIKGEKNKISDEKIESLKEFSGKLQDFIDMTSQRRFFLNMRGVPKNPHDTFFRDSSAEKSLDQNIYQALSRHTTLEKDDLDMSGLFDDCTLKRNDSNEFSI